MVLPERALAALLRSRALAGRRIDAVFLFGSHARGEATPASDVDLAVLCEPPLGLDRTAAMDQVGLAIDCDVDVIDLAVAPPILAWEVLSGGRLVYEGDGDRVWTFMRQTRYAAEDADRRNRMVLLAAGPAPASP